MELNDNPAFIGIMLSDGYIRPIRTKNGDTYFEMKQTTRNKDLLINIKKEFNKFDIKSQIKGIKTKLRHREEPYYELLLWTNSSSKLKDERKHWYPNGIKIVPQDLQITDKVLAYWYMGDGGVWRGGRDKHSVKITMYTNGFEKQDVEFLIKKLKKLEISSTIAQKKGNWVINISTASEVNEFMDLVKPYILPCFNYKLQYPKLVNLGGAPSRTAEAQSKYWNSLPERVRKQRNKQNWEKRKDKRNKERRLRYKKDPEYRKEILLKVNNAYKQS